MKNHRLAIILFAIIFSTTVHAQNIALGKSVYVSSLENAGQYPAIAAVDGLGAGSQINSTGSCISGNVCTRWSSAFSDPQWIYVDLGLIYSITSVRLYWEAARAKDFQIQTSNDATSWTTVQSITGNTAYSHTISMGSVNARYVRMYGTARTGAYGYSLWEFEVYGSLTILPIRLLDFSADFTNNGVALNWKANLSRASTFEIQRSSDATNFSTIDTLEVAAGTGSFTSSHFIDKHPADGKNFYRLKYNEKGESVIAYSNIVSVNTSANTTVSVYPNPVKGNSIQVNLSQLYSGPAQVVFLNMAGAVVSTQMLQLSTSRQFQAVVKPGLAKGMYWLKVITNQSTEQVKVSIE